MKEKLNPEPYLKRENEKKRKADDFKNTFNAVTLNYCLADIIQSFLPPGYPYLAKIVTYSNDDKYPLTFLYQCGYLSSFE